jgi:hypothetical protein
VDRDGAPDGLTGNVGSLRQLPFRKERQKQRRKTGRRDPTQGQNQDPRAGKEQSAPMSVAPYAYCLTGHVVAIRELPTLGAGRACHNASPLSPKRHGRDDPKQKNAGF